MTARLLTWLVALFVWMAPVAAQDQSPEAPARTQRDTMTQMTPEEGMTPEGMTMNCTCQSAAGEMMRTPLGIACMVLLAALLLSMIAALISLSVFLIRRSRPTGA